MRLGSPDSFPAPSGPNCAVVMLSCDRYRDLWPASTVLFNRYWPDCPWPKYLASDLVPPVYPGFIPLGAGITGLDWSSLLQRVLAQVPADHVLLFLDDFFLTARADTAAIDKIWQEMHRLGAGHVRLVPHARLLRPLPESSLLGEHVRGLPYRASLQAGFWRRDLLESLLRTGESPWQFEIAGSIRSEALVSGFLAAWRNPVPYVDVLERGKWLPRGVQLCRREKLAVDFSVRSQIAISDRVRRGWSQLVSFGVEAIPQSWRKHIRAYRRAAKARQASC